MMNEYNSYFAFVITQTALQNSGGHDLTVHYHILQSLLLHHHKARSNISDYPSMHENAAKLTQL